jgi:hypothetical protein
MRWSYLFLIVVVMSGPACTDSRGLPDDPQLEVFIRTMAAYAHAERAYSGNPVMLEREMADIDFPPLWEELVDSLLITYEGQPDFWQAVYTEILERSRLPADQP